MKTLLLFIAIALSINVFGQSTVKIGNLEVMTEDLEGRMKWDEAVRACADLGDGWRLPTKEELKMLYENRDKIGGFADYGYWSSTESGSSDAWLRSFVMADNQFAAPKSFAGSVRAVRDLAIN